MTDQNNKNIVIIGSSGHAKVVIDIIERESKYKIIGFIDSFKKLKEAFFGYEILGAENDLPALVERHDLHGGIVAIGDNWTRYRLAERIKALLPAFQFITTIHPSAQVARGVAIGVGSVLMPGCIVNSDSKVGNFCILNTKASLDHDGIMEDFSSLASNVTTGGNVSIGAFSALLLGSNILHGRRIGKHTVIGPGGVVLDDIPDFCVASGVPAKVTGERREGDKYL